MNMLNNSGVKNAALSFGKIWASLFYGSSWMGLILALICFASGAGVTIIVGMIFLVYSFGGFFVSYHIKKGIRNYEEGNVNVPSSNNNYIPHVSSGSSNSNHVIIEGKIFERDANGNFRFVGNIVN